MICHWLHEHVSFLAEWPTYGWWGCTIGWNNMGGVEQCSWSHPLAVPSWIRLERSKYLCLEYHDVVRASPKFGSLTRISGGRASRRTPWSPAPLVSLYQATYKMIGVFSVAHIISPRNHWILEGQVVWHPWNFKRNSWRAWSTWHPWYQK